MDGLGFAKDIIVSIANAIEKAENNREALRSINNSFQNLLNALEEGCTDQGITDSNFKGACDQFYNLVQRYQKLARTLANQSKWRQMVWGRKVEGDIRKIMTEVKMMSDVFQVQAHVGIRRQQAESANQVRESLQGVCDEMVRLRADVLTRERRTAKQEVHNNVQQVELDRRKLVRSPALREVRPPSNPSSSRTSHVGRDRSRKGLPPSPSISNHNALTSSYSSAQQVSSSRSRERDIVSDGRSPQGASSLADRSLATTTPSHQPLRQQRNNHHQQDRSFSLALTERVKSTPPFPNAPPEQVLPPRVYLRQHLAPGLQPASMPASVVPSRSTSPAPERYRVPNLTPASSISAFNTPAAGGSLTAPPSPAPRDRNSRGYFDQAMVSKPKVLTRVQVLYSYTANPADPNEMSIERGEVLDVLDRSGRWWIAQRPDGFKGMIPSNLITEIPSLIRPRIRIDTDSTSYSSSLTVSSQHPVSAQFPKAPLDQADQHFSPSRPRKASTETVSTITSHGTGTSAGDGRHMNDQNCSSRAVGIDAQGFEQRIAWNVERPQSNIISTKPLWPPRSTFFDHHSYRRYPISPSVSQSETETDEEEQLSQPPSRFSSPIPAVSVTGPLGEVSSPSNSDTDDDGPQRFKCNAWAERGGHKGGHKGGLSRPLTPSSEQTNSRPQTPALGPRYQSTASRPVSPDVSHGYEDSSIWSTGSFASSASSLMSNGFNSIKSSATSILASATTSLASPASSCPPTASSSPSDISSTISNPISASTSDPVPTPLFPEGSGSGGGVLGSATPNHFLGARPSVMKFFEAFSGSKQDLPVSKADAPLASSTLGPNPKVEANFQSSFWATREWFSSLGRT